MTGCQNSKDYMMRNLLLISGIVFLFFSCSSNTQVINLDEMDLSRMETGWGEIRINKTVDGNTLTVAGVEYERGLGAHSIFKFMVELGGNGKSFRSKVGIDDESGPSASVEFFILGDKEVLWQSGLMKSGEPAKQIDISIKGVQKLALLATDGGDNINYDHIDWIDSRIEFKGEKPVATPPFMGNKYILTPTVGDTVRINGPRFIGANPGNPFLYRVPVTGKEPISITVENLPEGLFFDPDTRLISGITNFSGRRNIIVTANNELGAKELGEKQPGKRQFGEKEPGADRVIITLRSDMGLALTPPLGWNSWNCWGLSVDQDKVKAAADAMVKSGLADHGWTYINIDDGWEADKRTKSGDLLANDKFPDMKELADYCHDYGLKLGIYSSPGPSTCGGYLGSYEHELQDLKTWAAWGIDYVKYDWCGYSQVVPDNSLAELQKPYAFFRDQLDKVNRDIVYSICQYGMGDVWEWGEKVGGNLWRTTYDITDTWSSMSEIGFGQAKTSKFAGYGHWNDPDMLVVGQVGWGPSLHASKLSPDEQYTHVSLWSLLAAPLLIGCDMSQLDDFTLSLLTNDEVLAINQDAKGVQAVPVKQQDGVEIWAKKLLDGSIAVGMFNTGENSVEEAFIWDNEIQQKEIQISWHELGIPGALSVRDVWRQQEHRGTREYLQATVPYHGVVLLRVTPAK